MGAAALFCLYYSFYPTTEIADFIKLSSEQFLLTSLVCLLTAVSAYFIMRNLWKRMATLLELLAVGEWDSLKMLHNLEVMPLLFIYAFIFDLLINLLGIFLHVPADLLQKAASDTPWEIMWEFLLPKFYGTDSLIMALLFYVLYKTLAERKQMHEAVRAIEEEHKLVI